MNDKNLPERKIYEAKPMKISVGGSSEFSEKQRDAMIQAGSKAVEDIGSIVKDLVAIQKIKEQSNADIALIEAETRKIVQSVRVEIERQVQQGQDIRTRGQVAVDVIAQITSTIKEMPDLDAESRHKLIDSIFPLVQLAVA